MNRTENSALKRPLIGVTPTIDDATQRITVNQSYLDAVSDAGAIPVLLPLLPADQLPELLDRLDGIMLTGGADVGPSVYGEEVRSECGTLAPPRDAFEAPLTRLAFDRDMPILGICRGNQMLNAVLGGTLYQDIELNLQKAPGFAGEAVFHPCYTRTTEFIHDVRLAPGDCLLRRVLSAAPDTCCAANRAASCDAANCAEKTASCDTFFVNSSHHQGIKLLAPGLVANAYARDGLIESIHAPGKRFVLGTQWHPERLTAISAEARAIFAAFVSACR